MNTVYVALKWLDGSRALFEYDKTNPVQVANMRKDTQACIESGGVAIASQNLNWIQRILG